ncbi:MAG: pyridoxal-phosphate dependent enzyme [Labilithrix sp.]|nr:pyridoxal-phosphate dependent enzyme [Labilithrix sp.]MCW5816378.1 pyridoxal-phosphate dependent enzyme [Labilithrix sp.]
MPRRLYLAHLPTPIERRPALDEIVGAKVWVKRDDATGGAEAGNKIRKLELLLADALDEKAELVITCGGLQSNHARATALSCARLGLRCVLYLRVADPAAARARLDATGNVLLDRLAGAELVFITPDEYRQRDAIMHAAQRELASEQVAAYVVPEGGSNGLGALGYVEAMREVRAQIDLGLAPRFDAVAHACGSGGTAAGVALGARAFDVADRAWAFAVCDDAMYFKRRIEAIIGEARGWDSSLPAKTGLVVDDAAKGPAYAVMDDEQKRFLTLIAKRTGFVFDPVYTGKAIWGLARAVSRGDVAAGANVLFLHTGGLPGLLAQGGELEDALA